MIGLIASIASAVLPKLFGTIDKAVADKDLAAKLKMEMQVALLAVDSRELEAARSIIVAEAQGGSPAQRNWRPHLMYLIMGLLVFNGVAVPIAAAYGVTLPILEAWTAIPSQMWTLLQIGLGGYIVGRSGEKMMKSFTEKK